MAKTEADLAWDRVRREVQYRINLAAATWRIEKLNSILPALQARFEDSLNEGVLLELVPADVSWINEVLEIEGDV